jgi:hypothetical protein
VVAFVGGETAWSMSEQDSRDTYVCLSTHHGQPRIPEEYRLGSTSTNVSLESGSLEQKILYNPAMKALIFRFLSRLFLPPGHSVIREDTELPCLPSRT